MSKFLGGRNMGIKEVTYYNSDGTTQKLQYKIKDKFNENGYLVDNRKNSIKNEYKLLPRELTKAERGDLSDLKVLIGKDQLLVYRSGNIYKPHTEETIAKFLDTSVLQAKRLLKKAKQCNVIAEIKINDTKYYMYNPYYERVVDRISFIVYLAFQDTELRDMIEPQYRGKFQKQIEASTEKIEVLKNDKKDCV